VKSIMPNATTSSGVVNYTVYLKLDQLDTQMRTGMSATIDIETTVAENVLAVPSAAVKTNNGSKYVLVVGPNGTTTNKTVTVGVSDDSYTQIVSGIAEGTAVSTGAASSASSGSSRSGGNGSSSSSRQGAGMMMGGPGAGGPPPGAN
jgi:multidrug efflux pump subunit AcrA (membrane-fusion protein)